MNQFKKSRLIVVSSVVILLSLSLLFLTVKKGLLLKSSNDATGALSFVNRFLSRPVNFLAEKKDNLQDLVDTYRENQELKRTLSSLESKSEENISLKSENASLRENLNMVEAYPDKKLLSATVSLRTPASWSDQLVIDLGTNQGVNEKMLVMANGGLVGIVDAANSSSSKVRLLSSSDGIIKIPVKISTAKSNIYGILSGYDTESNSLIIDQLNSVDDIPRGSNVVTSDLAGNTASNLQVGKVATVKTSSSNLKRQLYVTPTANFSNIYAVMVVGE